MARKKRNKHDEKEIKIRHGERIEELKSLNYIKLL